MEPKDFINKDLNDGDKVKLTLKDGRVLEGYFGGYKCYKGNCSWLGYNVFPVFYRVGKKGECVKRALLEDSSPAVSFLSIDDVERITVPYRHVGYYNNPDDCYNLGLRGQKAALQAWKNGEGAFINVDNNEPFEDVVPDDDTEIFENGRYAVRFSFRPKDLTAPAEGQGDEDCGIYIDIFERIEDAK